MPELKQTADGYTVKCDLTFRDKRVALSLFNIVQAFETSVTNHKGRKRPQTPGKITGHRLGA